MSRNIELKARYADLTVAADIAAAMGAEREGVEWQRDTYFQVNSGRLKLRQRRPEGRPEENQLIGYHREDHTGSRGSDYRLIPIDDGQALRSTLTNTLGTRKEVIKQRTVYRLNRVRIHLDDVENLGIFIEFEAIVDDQCEESSAWAKVKSLSQQFRIDPNDVIGASYVDLQQNL
jgi:predicted adenylyl cyclase CyaB